MSDRQQKKNHIFSYLTKVNKTEFECYKTANKKYLTCGKHVENNF